MQARCNQLRLGEAVNLSVRRDELVGLDYGEAFEEVSSATLDMLLAQSIR